jgi:transposase-like protein
MAVSEVVNLSGLLDEAKCFELVRQHRWPDGVRCPDCDSAVIIRNGHDDGQRHRQRYLCKACHGRFDDLTGTVLAGHHQPLRVWVLCLYLMGLNLSNRQIAQELGLDASDVQAMTEHLRQGLVARAPVAKLDDTAEIDEVYIVAGHKGQPAEVVKRGAQDGVAGFQVRRDAARWKRRNHRRWCMCGRPLGCKRENEKSDGRIDCDHVSGLFSRRMTAGPDGIRDPAPNSSATLTSLCTKRVLWIVGSTERHLIQLFHPGINARFSQSPAGAGRLPRALSRPRPVGRCWSRLQLRSGWNTGRGHLVVHSRSKPCGG